MFCKDFLDSFPLDVADRLLAFLPKRDFANLRLVNKQWKALTNRYVTRWHPLSLTALLRGDVPALYPSLNAVDLSSVDVVDDTELRQIGWRLAEIPFLRDVTLRCGRGVTREGFASFGRCLPNLHTLTLTPVRRGCSVDETPSADLDVVAFEAFPQLKRLDLSWNVVTPAALTSMTGLRQLEILNLKNCIGVDDAAVECLTAMASLRVVNLSSTNVTDEGLMTMNDLELEGVNLSKCEGITDDGMFWLQHIRSLRRVDISSCPGISSAGVEQLTNLPNLADLYLQDMKPFGGSFFKKMKHLKKISLRDCAWVTNAMLESMTSCKTLQDVNLRNCHQITDAGLESLQELPDLRSVNLRGCSQITDTGLKCLALLPHLQDMDLSFLNRITDAGLFHVAEMASLERLVLNWCNLITSFGLRAIQYSGLRELSIKGCHNMEFSDLVSMAKLCNVQKLDYEHSLCSVHPDHDLPLMRPIDSCGCFMEIC